MFGSVSVQLYSAGLVAFRSALYLPCIVLYSNFVRNNQKRLFRVTDHHVLKSLSTDTCILSIHLVRWLEQFKAIGCDPISCETWLFTSHVFCTMN